MLHSNRLPWWNRILFRNVYHNPIEQINTPYRLSDFLNRQTLCLLIKFKETDFSVIIRWTNTHSQLIGNQMQQYYATLKFCLQLKNLQRWKITLSYAFILVIFFQGFSLRTWKYDIHYKRKQHKLIRGQNVLRFQTPLHMLSRGKKKVTIFFKDTRRHFSRLDKYFSNLSPLQHKLHSAVCWPFSLNCHILLTVFLK